jgi:hypothetical protein
LRIVAGYTRKDQVRNTKIGEELNIFNLNNKVLKSRSHATTGRRISKKILTCNPKRRKNIKTPTVKTEGPAYSSRGKNRPQMA